MRKTQDTKVRGDNEEKILWTMSENGELVLALALAFFLNAAIRLIEYGAWQAEPFFIGQEPLMATHDAYAWLAGAKGVGYYAVSRFAGMIRLMHEVSGLQLGTIGFWLPIVTVPWLALPVCLLARFMRLTEAGVIIAVMSGSSLGFLVRTRLGFCDTDLVALFLPLVFTCAVTAWLATQIRVPWGMSEGGDFSDSFRPTVLALLAGTFGGLNVAFYGQGGSVLLAVLGITALLGFVLSPRSHIPRVWAGLLLIYALTFGGILGFAVAVALVAVLIFRPSFLIRREGWIALALGTALIFLYAGLHMKISDYLQMIMTYAKLQPIDLVNNASALKLPDIVQSVREAQNLEWGQMAERIAGHWFLLVLGLLGYFLAVFRRPSLLVFLPFLVLGVSSVKLGNRFSMYGGVALGVGFGFGLAELMRMLGQSQGRRWIAQLGLCCFALWPAGEMMREIQPVTVLPKVYAQTFLDLRKETEPDARLWQWWDYGYAGQYYAERATFGDGGMHDGAWLYPLARVHSTDSPRQASQLMKYITLAQRDMIGLENATSYYGTNPVAKFEAMGPINATSLVGDLAVAELEFPADLPAQYFVLSWENLRLGSWISYYGNWDLVAGSSEPGKIQQVQGEIKIDSVTGALIVNGTSLALDSLDVIGEDKTRHFVWSNGTGKHVLINQNSRQVFLMDPKMYKSMMVQMLINDPQSFEPYFELVNDKYPWARVYKVK